MKQSLVKIITLLIALFSLTMFSAAQEVPQINYYLADDAEGVQQVYQLLLDGNNEARQITFAENDILTFGVAHDGLSVAYVSDGQLWLQPIHTEAPEALAELTMEQFFSVPVYSQEYIAYADNGVWLFDLATRETRQILENVELKPDGSNMADLRVYRPSMFILDDEGKATKLVVDIGIWEWGTPGIYDLNTGELQMLEGTIHTKLFPLADGRALLYGNGGVAGEFALHIAEDIEDINTYERVLEFAELTENTLYAEQAVEIEPGIIRIYGTSLGDPITDSTGFYFDFNVETNEAGEVNFFTLATGEESEYTITGALSPDGKLIPVYMNTLWTDQGMIYGTVRLLDITTGEALDIDFPEPTSVIRWQE